MILTDVEGEAQRRSRWPSGRRGLVLVLVLSLAGCGAGDSAPSISSTGSPIFTTTTTSSPVGTQADAGTSSIPAEASTTTVSQGASLAHPEPAEGIVDRWLPEILDTRTHDPTAFTQGLVVRGDTVYESTGLYGASTVRVVDRVTGEVLRRAELDTSFFGEGLELVGDRLVQLTWRERTAIVWDPTGLEEIGRFEFEGEGWGLCSDGDRFVMSDGSAALEFRDLESFDVTGNVTVTMNGAPVTMLNELECVGGLVFANVWQTTDIVVIDPDAGVVTAVIDATALDTIDDTSGTAVLNGIAYDADDEVFLLTGKLWPTVYEVRFVEE